MTKTEKFTITDKLREYSMLTQFHALRWREDTNNGKARKSLDGVIDKKNVIIDLMESLGFTNDEISTIVQEGVKLGTDRYEIVERKF
jgi:hypothetical protein